MRKTGCVILNYNDCETTISLLKLIASYNAIDVIIVVDNMSTDDSYSILQKYESEKIHIVRTDKNGGYGYGNNYGIGILYDEYNCEFSIIANPDVVFSDECINALKEILIKDDKAIIAAPIQINGFTNKEIESTSWSIPSYVNYVVGPLYICGSIYSRLRKKPKYNNAIEYVDCVPGAFLMVKNREFLLMGGYDENIFLYCEESIIGYKAKQNGYRSILCRNKQYEHYHSLSINRSIGKVVNQKKILFKSRMYFLQNYLKIGAVRTIIARACFAVSLSEEYLRQVIKSRPNRNSI